jgi:hypothetical protein
VFEKFFDSTLVQALTLLSLEYLPELNGPKLGVVHPPKVPS